MTNQHKKKYISVNNNFKLWMTLIVILLIAFFLFFSKDQQIKTYAAKLLSLIMIISGLINIYLGYQEYHGEYGKEVWFYTTEVTTYIYKGKKAKQAGLINIALGLIFGVIFGFVILYLTF